MEHSICEQKRESEVTDFLENIEGKVVFIEANPTEEITSALLNDKTEVIPGLHVYYNGRYIWLSNCCSDKYYRTEKTIQNMLAINNEYSKVIKLCHKKVLNEVEQSRKTIYNFIGDFMAESGQPERRHG